MRDADGLDADVRQISPPFGPAYADLPGQGFPSPACAHE
jgi:hypothetical protein